MSVPETFIVSIYKLDGAIFLDHCLYTRGVNSTVMNNRAVRHAKLSGSTIYKVLIIFFAVAMTTHLKYPLILTTKNTVPSDLQTCNCALD